MDRNEKQTERNMAREYEWDEHEEQSPRRHLGLNLRRAEWFIALFNTCYFHVLFILNFSCQLRGLTRCLLLVFSISADVYQRQNENTRDGKEIVETVVRISETRLGDVE